MRQLLLTLLPPFLLLSACLWLTQYSFFSTRELPVAYEYPNAAPTAPIETPTPVRSLFSNSEVAQCISDFATTPCSVNRSCNGFSPRNCGIVNVPVWQAPLSHVACCLRCCVANWAADTGGMKRFELWRRGLSGRAQAEWGELHPEDPFMPVMGCNEVMKFADVGVPLWTTPETFEPRLVTRRRESGIVVSHDLRGLAGIWCMLNRIAFNVTLVLLYDQEFPGPAADGHLARHILDHPRVSRIFCTNPGYYNLTHRQPCLLRHPKLQGIPIGAKKPRFWPTVWNGSESEWLDRPELLLCSGISLHRDRLAKWQQLRANGFNCTVAALPGKAYASAMGSAHFVFSPTGNGRNNFREWESILMGAVPLIDEAPGFHELWAGLPVVRVSNWSQVTPEYLRGLIPQIWAQRESYNIAKLFLPHWLYALHSQQGTTDPGEYKSPGSSSRRCQVPPAPMAHRVWSAQLCEPNPATLAYALG
eukprot:TRINITY_DN22050_c0_g1_i1.p1 TRINITY_DN22050_c0_g1~~TRINITY_DN22050_c0_g1_i1.p1  ORF type:complete len:482 (-),score=36.78 TRINITY_DN22050_c0_g1_i1:66-1490(-)